MPINNIIQEQHLAKRICKLMGNRFEISAVTEDERCAQEKIHAAVEEIRRIEQLLTTYNEQSQTTMINSNAGNQPVQVDQEVYDLIERSIKISKLTQGRSTSATDRSTSVSGTSIPL